MREAVHGLSQIDLRAQEIKDMEVARRLQEEELKVRIPLLYQQEHFDLLNSHEYISPISRQVNLTSELLKLHKTRLVGVSS